MKNCKFRRKHCKFRRLLAQVLFLWYHKYNFNEEEVFMKKKVLSLLTAAVACQAKRKKVTRKTQKTALIYPIYGNQSGFSYVI